MWFRSKTADDEQRIEDAMEHGDRGRVVQLMFNDLRRWAIITADLEPGTYVLRYRSGVQVIGTNVCRLDDQCVDVYVGNSLAFVSVPASTPADP